LISLIDQLASSGNRVEFAKNFIIGNRFDCVRCALVAVRPECHAHLPTRRWCCATYLEAVKRKKTQ
jgi:hypothetical protein